MTGAVHRAGQRQFGPWGNHTSTLDWCEDNYTHLPFIAEFWNSLSSIPFIFLGIFGVLSVRGLPGGSRYAMAHTFMAVIGVGSFIFHGTLLWHAQVILDELPMIWSGAMFTYMTCVGGKDQGSLRLKATCAAGPLLISWAYLLYPNPILHQVAYGAIQVVNLYYIRGLFNDLPTNAPERSECKANLAKGVVTFLLGFALWNLDNVFCDDVTLFRAGRGELLGLLTQGHAWWHLLTGLGASRLCFALTLLCLAGRHPGQFEFAYFLGHPYVRRKPTRRPSKAKITTREKAT